MNVLQTVIFITLYTLLSVLAFAAFGSEIHEPSYIAAIVFVYILQELNAHYGRKRELKERERIAEEYERRFGKNEAT